MCIEVSFSIKRELLELGVIEQEEQNYALTHDGAIWLKRFGLPATELKQGRRHFARPCLDWSERRHHMAGSLGAAVTSRLFAHGWIERIPGSRALRVTGTGLEGFETEFSIKFR